MMKLASFDIFDTALVRKCGAPENIFYFLAERLYPDDPALREDFLVWRKYAEGDTIAGIYATADFPGYAKEDLIAAELSVESENLAANPAVAQKIAERRRTGYAILFVSDMYLPSAFLEEILRREKCLEGGEKVFVSCEENARKDTGDLYRLLREKYHPSEWIHCGDNLKSDVKCARRAGIGTDPADAAFSDAEIFCRNAAKMLPDPAEVSVLTGFSRYARMRKKNDRAAVLAADFIAPAYLPYIERIMREAKQENVRRLYFLSRDGYVLKRIAEEWRDGPELHELFVSRASLLLPYLADDFSRTAYLRVMEHGTLLGGKVSELLQSLQVGEMDLNSCGITFPYETIHSRDLENDFLDKIFASDLTGIVKEKAQKAKNLVLRYFRQEKLFDEGERRFVDVGWLGTSRLMLRDILRSAGQKEAEFYYYGVRRDVFRCSAGKYRSFFREGGLSTETTIPVEHYFSASCRPSTASYREENGIVVPVWKNQDGIPEELVETHVQICGEIARLMNDFAPSEAALYLWAKSSLDFWTGMHGPVDWTPLLQLPDFDGVRFVKKLSVAEVCRIAAGFRVTAFDVASLQVTLGFFAAKQVMRWHRLAIRCFYPLYKIWKRHRNHRFIFP
ncbi:MAG: hypothetical protein MJ016_00660 [Victivallaceae bacterium]|nr:hypothetical protein [Victivallaceae bacterium]